LTAYELPAPTINLSCKFGVPFNPLHRAHPVGIEAMDPDHIIIPPTGVRPGRLFVKALPVVVPFDRGI
jgi:hypothetical protein